MKMIVRERGKPSSRTMSAMSNFLYEKIKFQIIAVAQMMHFKAMTLTLFWVTLNRGETNPEMRRN